jgi:hypothetical protein
MMYHLFLAPSTLWTWEMGSWNCRDTPTRRLLTETLTMVGWDVLQLARVSPKTGRKSLFYLDFPRPSPTA